MENNEFETLYQIHLKFIIEYNICAQPLQLLPDYNYGDDGGSNCDGN
jgi:hypothetical protein